MGRNRGINLSFSSFPPTPEEIEGLDGRVKGVVGGGEEGVLSMEDTMTNAMEAARSPRGVRINERN
jgi:hypothetical protein